jgi:hypothetical protein
MGGSKTTTSNTVDPKLMALYQQNYNSASALANTPYQPYTGQGVAPLSSNQTQAESILGNLASNPQFGSTLNNATNAVQGILGSVQNAPSLANTDLTPYMNPYQQDVINATMTQLNQQQQQALMSGHENATLDNAFGGNRVGVQDALTTGQYANTDAQTLAQLNASNFANAQQAAEYDMSNQLQRNSLGLTGANDLASLGMEGFNLAADQGGLLDSVGAEQQQQQQNLDNWNYQQYQNQLNWPFQMQDLKNAALGLIPLQQTQTSTTSQNGLSGILGPLSQIGSALIMAP